MIEQYTPRWIFAPGRGHTHTYTYEAVGFFFKMKQVIKMRKLAAASGFSLVNPSITIFMLGASYVAGL